MTKKHKIKKSIDILKEAIQEDDDYAWTWHCNFAVPFQDEGASHEQANRAAARIMSLLFEVDVTKLEQWQSFPWHTNQQVGN